MSDERLTAAVDALERVPAQVEWADVERRLAGDTASPFFVGPGPRVWAKARLRVALVVIAVLLVTAGLTTISRDRSPESVRTGPGPSEAPSTATSTAPPSSMASTSTTAPATRTLRTFPVVAFTGEEYLVWGGEAGENDVSVRADGFAVSLDSGAVRPIPVAPIEPRSGATGVWTGSELIVCCGSGLNDGLTRDTRSAAAWDPSTGRWRTLARPPSSVARSFPASVWTGDLMVVMAAGPAMATYDPAADRWTEVVAPPRLDRLPEAVWTGDEVILWDRRFGSGQSPPTGEIADQGWRWTPGATAWEALPPLPPTYRTELGSVAWTGTEVLVWGDSTSDPGAGTGARWRPGDDGWSPMSPSPQDRVDDYNGTPGSQAVVADAKRSRVLIRGLEGNAEAVGQVAAPLFVYVPETDRWTRTDLVVAGYHPLFGVAGDAVVVPDDAAPIVGTVPR